MVEPYYTLETLEPNVSVGYLIKRCGILMTQLAERRFESQDISFTQWMILMWLSKREHASPTELSTHLGHDMGALTRVVDDLERISLVRRERSRSDRRAVEIAVTPEGRRLAQAGKRLMVGLMNEVVGPYSKQETELLISLLQRMLGQLQDTAAPLAPGRSGRVASEREDNATRATSTGTRRAAKQSGRKTVD